MDDHSIWLYKMFAGGRWLLRKVWCLDVHAVLTTCSIGMSKLFFPLAPRMFVPGRIVLSR